MQHLLPQPPHNSHYGPWPPPFHEYGANYAGDAYTVAQHLNSEQDTNNQHLQYGHLYHQSYAQNEAAHHAPPDAPMSYWSPEQVPTATNAPPVSTPPVMGSIYYSPPTFENANIPPNGHHHAAADGHFQPDLPTVCCGTTYDATSLAYAESDTFGAPCNTSALPAIAPYPTIAHNQSESGHDHVQRDLNVRSALYESNATFQHTEPSYTQIGAYVDAYSTAVVPQHHYAPPSAKEDQQPYTVASGPALDAQDHYAEPVPAAVSAPSEPKAESSGAPPRARSPMDHLPYPEDVPIKAERKSKHPSALNARRQSPPPRPTSTRTSTPTPAPVSPALPPLTFITYPETEPRGLRDGRGGGGTESDDHGDDDDGSSPSRRGRRGKKQPKKDPFLACFFCRGRKIACHPKTDGEDRTCT
ncbi:hypothetical protein BC826DRAFT_1016006 [Russula brevipes]|nr:hypothetical protein BC826DRAFT_1016006 [Russula brevipes]